jgi:hypothetical protein
MKAPILIILFLILAGLILSIVKKGKQESLVQNMVTSNKPAITGQMVVDSLEIMGYFKMADPDKIDTLKKEIRESFDQYKVLTTVEAEKPPFNPYCRRYYICDGEDLFEIDGLVYYLNVLKPTFEKLGIPLNWSHEYFSDDATEHTIVLNNKKYFAFKGDPNSLLIWGLATKNFVEMLNDQLKLHNSDERVYPIMAGNDGRIVFLTRQQYDFIFQYYDEKEKPKEVNLWWRESTKD